MSSQRDAYGYTEAQYEAADRKLDEMKDDRMEREHTAFARQHGRIVLCRHCFARHDGTTRALDLHPDKAHERPRARIVVRQETDRPHSWYYCVSSHHSGYAYDEECARRAAMHEAERLGIEVER